MRARILIGAALAVAAIASPSLAQDPGSTNEADAQALDATSKTYGACADAAAKGHTSAVRQKLGDLTGALTGLLGFLSQEIRDFVETNVLVFVEEVQNPPVRENQVTVTQLEDAMAAASAAAGSAAARLKDITGG